MDQTIIFLVLAGLTVVFFVVYTNRNKGGGRNSCTRCNGSGEINEKWPDPQAPGGWHKLEGICPKCKGKGRV